ncbi:MAG: PKD domain-containing protein [Bacteroidia bacterium]|nr:PKD domain-containing protein [Bacteroidia bacterium]
MDEVREDKMLSDLFRQKLENAEVAPSPSVGAGLMRKVGRKEFLRFNPSKINVWYAGALAAAGTALALILSSSPDIKPEKAQEPVQIETTSETSVNGGYNNQPAVNIKSSGENAPTISNQNKSGLKTGSKTAPDKKTENKLSENMAVESTGTQKVSTLPATGVLSDASAENTRLRRNPKSDAYIAASAISGCSPLKITFRCLAVPFDSCSWYFGDGGYSTLKDPVWIFDNAGDYKVTLNIFCSGLKSVSSVVITVHPKPMSKFEITPDDAFLPQDEITFHNYSEGAEKYKWDFGDGANSDIFEPRHSYRKYGNYSIQLISISEYGCSDSLVINNAFSKSGYFIDFPNAFIPNTNGPSGGYYSQKSDETSQIFHPVFSGVTDYQLRIFSKRSMLIFESNDVNYGWDGYFKGQLCDPGVYIWKVRGNFMSGEQFTKMGDVTLLKN